LVDADELRALQHSHGAVVAEGADQCRELDEGAEVLAARGRVPGRGEEVGLADAEAAVEVDARLARRTRPRLRRLLAAEAEETAAGDGRLGLGERPQQAAGLLLRRVLGVGPVRVERGVIELRR